MTAKYTGRLFRPLPFNRFFQPLTISIQPLALFQKPIPQKSTWRTAKAKLFQTPMPVSGMLYAIAQACHTGTWKF
jgi:hypothetical protein